MCGIGQRESLLDAEILSRRVSGPAVPPAQDLAAAPARVAVVDRHLGREGRGEFYGGADAGLVLLGAGIYLGVVSGRRRPPTAVEASVSSVEAEPILTN
uniref:Uncharacterized protein n=1 Tax=Rhodococcus hoagii TaxID=43767 RepID=A0A1Z1UYZ6_RHOHA|nr:hypothetical protein pVAPN1572_0402 [Prescottella equi]